MVFLDGFFLKWLVVVIMTIMLLGAMHVLFQL